MLRSGLRSAGPVLVLKQTYRLLQETGCTENSQTEHDLDLNSQRRAHLRPTFDPLIL